jgi:dimethylargininase
MIFNPHSRVALEHSFMNTALTRRVSPSIGDCQLTFVSRQRIDYAKACAQQQNYERLLKDLGYNVISMQPQAKLPDAVFVEDCAVVLDELAVMGRPARESRRDEVHSVAQVLAQYRLVEFLEAGTIEGGDVISNGKTLYVGISTRTEARGASQLQEVVSRYGYEVKTVAVPGCLHLSTAASFLKEDLVLVNPEWVDTTAFRNYKIVPIIRSEPWAANVLMLDETVVAPESCPETCAMLRELGFHVLTVDISELQKAEGGITCMSLVFDAEVPQTSITADIQVLEPIGGIG